MRVLLGVVLMAATLTAGCAGMASTPYNGQQACDIVGGIYTADGRCRAGNG